LTHSLSVTAWRREREMALSRPGIGEPASGTGCEGEGSAVCFVDALDDRQAEADTGVVGAYAFGAALKGLGKRGNQLWGDVSPVFSTVSTALSG
jgi:hypothetical protein